MQHGIVVGEWNQVTPLYDIGEGKICRRFQNKREEGWRKLRRFTNLNKNPPFNILTATISRDERPWANHARKTEPNSPEPSRCPSCRSSLVSIRPPPTGGNSKGNGPDPGGSTSSSTGFTQKKTFGCKTNEMEVILLLEERFQKWGSTNVDKTLSTFARTLRP